MSTAKLVWRCKTCGTQFDSRGDGRCEADLEPLALFCAVHRIWIPGATCARCAAEAKPKIIPPPIEAPKVIVKRAETPKRPIAPVKKGLRPEQIQAILATGAKAGLVGALTVGGVHAAVRYLAPLLPDRGTAWLEPVYIKSLLIGLLATRYLVLCGRGWRLITRYFVVRIGVVLGVAFLAAGAIGSSVTVAVLVFLTIFCWDSWAKYESKT
jgi:hypothetical protein